MGRIIVPIVVGVVLLAFLVWIYMMVRTPKPKPVLTSRDDPLYRGLIEFTRKVAYFNDLAPEWAVMIPAELTHEARQLLDQEKKELRIRNES